MTHGNRQCVHRPIFALRMWREKNVEPVGERAIVTAKNVSECHLGGGGTALRECCAKRIEWIDIKQTTLNGNTKNDFVPNQDIDHTILRKARLPAKTSITSLSACSRIRIRTSENRYPTSKENHRSLVWSCPSISP